MISEFGSLVLPEVSADDQLVQRGLKSIKREQIDSI